MPERPLILFSQPAEVEKVRRFGGGLDFHKPSHIRQVERLKPQFNALQIALDKGKLSISKSSNAIEPEYTLVLEVTGDPASFYTAVRHLETEHQGVEWLFELINENVPNDDDFYAVTPKVFERDDKKHMTYKYFCILTNQQALSDILSLWTNFSQNPKYKFPNGKTGLRDVFQTLRDIHLWGVEERFEETGIKKAWIEDLASTDLPEVKCEIELFFRRSQGKRNEVQQRIMDEIKKISGRVLVHSCIDAIGYHALLVSIPRQYAERILQNKEVSLISLEQIMFFKPTGQIVVSSSEESFEFEKNMPIPEQVVDEPIVALFDGLPQERHPLLDNMINIDDPDDFTSNYLVKNRLHGTSMASIIAHGDLLTNPVTLNRKIYVRPIMKPYPTSQGGMQEYFPDDLLIVDKIHEAVRRLFESTAGRVAPTIKVINLSIGIGTRLFYNMISPFAKLLDWLSFKYRVLFIVSARNHPYDIDLEMGFSDFAKLTNSEKDTIIIRVLDKRLRNQRLLSPAESINSLTIGALFSDGSDFIPKSRQILPVTDSLPSPINSFGRGINRSIKPDLLMPGGRNTLVSNIVQPNIACWRTGGSDNPPGTLTAKPILVDSGGNKVGYSFGTSNAAALASHKAMLCYNVLDEVFRNGTNEPIPPNYTALLIKAMLAHGAQWGKTADTIRDALNLSGRAADEIHKWLGYGVPDISRVEECTKNRVTLIGYGELMKDSAHLFNLPLPFDFHTQKMYRCLTVTLAYFTNIIPITQKYRGTQLWFNIEDNDRNLVSKRADASDKAVARGTLQHERFYNDAAIVWDENDSLKIRVNCREDAGNQSLPISYALFATFEIALQYNIDVYSKVVNRIYPKESVTT